MFEDGVASPDLDGTRPAPGRPSGNGIFQSRSTRSIAPGHRLDYWREQFVASRIEPVRGFDLAGFDSSAITSRLQREVTFAELQGDPVACRFGERRAPIVLLGGVFTGRVGIRRTGHPVFATNAATGLLLFNCDRLSETLSVERYGMRYLVLPADMVMRILGGAVDVMADGVGVMRGGVLQSVYSRQLQWMGHRGAGLSESDARSAMTLARALAVTVLAGFRTHWRTFPHEFDVDLITAARHMLTLHVDDIGFTAERLAATMRCSRAHLYRLLGQAGFSIGGELQRLRMQRAARLLQAPSAEPVGAVALRCGYTDLTAFGKAFRRRFGCTPTEWRHRIESAASPAAGG